jgi:hypothetical protein
MAEVNENINQISTVSSSITQDISSVNLSAREISDSSDQV